MKSANSKLFSKIIQYLEESPEYSDFDRSFARYVNTGTPQSQEKNWLKWLIKKDEFSLLPYLKFGTFEYMQESYIVVIGANRSVQLDEIFQEIEINAGLFTALISEFNVNVASHNQVNDIINDIMYLHEVDKYEGHDFNNILNVFESIQVYKIGEDAIIDIKDIYKIAGYYLALSRESNILNFNTDSLDCYKSLFLEGSKHISFEYITNSLIQTKWQYVFLDLYRCVEMVFPLIHIEELHRLFRDKGNYPISQLIKDVDKTIGKSLASLKHDRLPIKCINQILEYTHGVFAKS